MDMNNFEKLCQATIKDCEDGIKSESEDCGAVGPTGPTGGYLMGPIGVKGPGKLPELQGMEYDFITVDEFAEVTPEQLEQITKRIKSKSKHVNGAADKYYDADGKETRRRI